METQVRHTCVPSAELSEGGITHRDKVFLTLQVPQRHQTMHPFTAVQAVRVSPSLWHHQLWICNHTRCQCACSCFFVSHTPNSPSLTGLGNSKVRSCRQLTKGNFPATDFSCTRDLFCSCSARLCKPWHNSGLKQTCFADAFSFHTGPWGGHMQQSVLQRKKTNPHNYAQVLFLHSQFFIRNAQGNKINLDGWGSWKHDSPCYNLFCTLPVLSCSLHCVQNTSPY